MSGLSRCGNCGAPHQEGLARCAYCDVSIAGRKAGIDCPSCGELSTQERRSCAACGASFTKGCVFCGEVAFLTAVACGRCGEAFAGAADRKRERERLAKQQQMMGLAAQGISVVGQVAQHPTGAQVLGQIWQAVITSNNKYNG